jgi:hypothetical protein
MAWYAAHVLIAFKWPRRRQSKFGVYENVLLVRGRSPKEAFRKAERIARREEALDDKLTWNGKPAKREFLGVRKLITVTSPAEYRGAYDEPVDGSEITYSYLEVKGRKSLRKLAGGKAVAVEYME